VVRLEVVVARSWRTRGGRGGDRDRGGRGDHGDLGGLGLGFGGTRIQEMSW
jgi:hypothetical protein